MIYGAAPCPAARLACPERIVGRNVSSLNLTVTIAPRKIIQRSPVGLKPLNMIVDQVCDAYFFEQPALKKKSEKGQVIKIFIVHALCSIFLP